MRQLTKILFHEHPLRNTEVSHGFTRMKHGQASPECVRGWRNEPFLRVNRAVPSAPAPRDSAIRDNPCSSVASFMLFCGMLVDFNLLLKPLSKLPGGFTEWLYRVLDIEARAIGDLFQCANI